MSAVEHADLTCSRCGKETRHELAYAGRLLAAITCTECGKVIERDLRARYLTDLRQRLATKPKRMLRRFRKDPLRFASSLPKTVPAKPWELLSEIRLVWRTARAHRGDRTTARRRP
ncbi:hypothetical protein [Amycolatopsis taiwanensis]|uniref:Bh protein n=1 Tax=Amycolatopsis taiwanensis TaxID=342230 RepID=A0A9W6VGC4_9PSEU|nr:hypothetical protein [Amycolatopsis taiwanensis]GLY70628.1 hypothetical protein Atai01_72470 [Amycolatopsis taiwanensis]